ncbi:MULTISPECIES: anthrone oxygenase family protein [unclassified Nostoc]|uniref:anthrone oxygenase family protein n=1 Tax=unclassified Nostoc TaxID=2593658 RepID=UPI001D14F6FB|nr:MULTISPECIES: anthrone oxygenase family protein [unclassified Nostoc]
MARVYDLLHPCRNLILVFRFFGGEDNVEVDLFGSLLYLVGTILVTITFNVPLNDALAIAKPDSTEGAIPCGLDI